MSHFLLEFPNSFGINAVINLFPQFIVCTRRWFSVNWKINQLRAKYELIKCRDLKNFYSVTFWDCQVKCADNFFLSFCDNFSHIRRHVQPQIVLEMNEVISFRYSHALSSWKFEGNNRVNFILTPTPSDHHMKLIITFAVFVF